MDGMSEFLNFQNVYSVKFGNDFKIIPETDAGIEIDLTRLEFDGGNIKADDMLQEAFFNARRSESPPRPGTYIPYAYACGDYTSLEKLPGGKIEPRPHKCSQCGRRYAMRDYLRRHMKCHEGGAMFECKICDKSFTAQQTLANHMNVHDENRPYTCEQCNKRFTTLDYLRRHQQIHDEESKHPCEICNKVFATRRYYQRHLTVHDELRVRYKCFLCPGEKVFVRKQHLRRHMSVRHNPDKPDKFIQPDDVQLITTL